MDFLLTHLRHQLTFLASLGTMLLGWHLLAPDQVDAVNSAGAELVKPLSIIAGSVGVFVGRLVIAWLGKMLSHGTGENGNPPGWVGLLLICTLAGFVGLSLPACNSSQIAAARAIPIRACVTYGGVQVCASTK